MPIYEYRCRQGHTFEVMQRMTDDPLTSCSTCEAPVQRVFHPVAVHFKGSGFYSTDYGKKKTGAASPEGGKGEGGKGEGGKSEGSKSEGAGSEGSKSEGSKAEGSKSGGSGSKSASGGEGSSSSSSSSS